ncbi:hypothetical protein BDV95DRAFT_560031 [Massariosphaeria phaeospora]|uniref:Uncharacterized protein n=1 Tax=Massariosphaeria phaeospora TaxID=100035 RepID=A0A7C8MGP0_9PLEO|nr:hypothetical protein BDV95DRAFT_560031 [Massariosphaeria phaeospora]
MHLPKGSQSPPYHPTHIPISNCSRQTPFRPLSPILHPLLLLPLKPRPHIPPAIQIPPLQRHTPAPPSQSIPSATTSSRLAARDLEPYDHVRGLEFVGAYDRVARVDVLGRGGHDCVHFAVEEALRGVLEDAGRGGGRDGRHDGRGRHWRDVLRSCCCAGNADPGESHVAGASAAAGEEVDDVLEGWG